MNINRRKKFIIILILTTIIGLASGMVGAILARVYLLDKAFNIPFFGDLNYSSSELNGSGSSLIISGAKKVVVEQNTKVLETTRAVEKSIVGIFKKIPGAIDDSATTSVAQNNGELDLSKHYNINNVLGQGFIITSDGWILTDYDASEVKVLLNAKKEATAKELKKGLDNYVIITKDRIVYTVDNIIVDPNSNYSFWHIKANDLPVRKFASDNETHNGQLALAVNWDSWSWLTSIIGSQTLTESPIISSDEYSSELILDEAPNQEFYSTFLFNLGGDLLALIDSEGNVRPISNFVSCINCLLLDQEIKRPFLGVNYIELSNIVSDINVSGSGRGALLSPGKTLPAVIKNSPAEKAGFLEGDVILGINNIDLTADYTLNQAVSAFIAGEEISISYEREGRVLSERVVLGELINIQ